MIESAHNDDADANDVHTALLYRGRDWQEVENPIQTDAADTNWGEVLRRNGWRLTTTLGHEDDIGIDLYERCSQAACRYRWLAQYKTASLCKTIVIERWQDLIDFLAHVSSTMLAVVLPADTGCVLEALFEKTPPREEARERARVERSKQERQERLEKMVVPKPPKAKP